MTFPSLSFSVLCVLALVAALLGWSAPADPGASKWRDASVGVMGLAYASWWGRGFTTGLNFVVLLLGIYLAFSGWRDERTPPKSACSGAFFGAAFVLGSTSQRVEHIAIGYVLGAACYYLALWLSKGANRRIALGMVSAAALFQVSRMPILLAR